MSDTEPICVRFPTIMSGVVLRWYRDENAYAAGQQLANAGREGACVLVEGCPPGVMTAAADAAAAIRNAYARSLHPEIDTSRWETHTADFPSGKLSPIAATCGAFPVTAPVPAVPDVWSRAVEAGAEAIFDAEGPESIDDDGAEALAEVALRAALPVLLPDLAERIEDERMGRHVAEQRGLSRAAKTVRSFAAEVSRG